MELQLIRGAVCLFSLIFNFKLQCLIFKTETDFKLKKVSQLIKDKFCWPEPICRFLVLKRFSIQKWETFLYWKFIKNKSANKYTLNYLDVIFNLCNYSDLVWTSGRRKQLSSPFHPSFLGFIYILYGQYLQRLFGRHRRELSAAAARWRQRRLATPARRSAFLGWLPSSRWFSGRYSCYIASIWGSSSSIAIAATS